MVKTCGEAARFYLVSHGGSGSTQEKIDEALDYGVVKMNVDNDMQYAFHTCRIFRGLCFSFLSWC